MKLRPSLPNHYYCINTCVFYFNIEGSNDPSHIYLMVFAHANAANTVLILKNNQWFHKFPNNDRLKFPKRNCLTASFGSDFMVIFFYVFLCKKNNNQHKPNK